MEIKEEFTTARRKANGLRSSIFSGAIWVSGDSEANYLVGGHATELLDKVCFNYSTGKSAIVYGIEAAQKDRGRYVWIYLYFHNHIWKCHDIPKAYKIIERLKDYDNARKLESKLLDKLTLHLEKS